MTINFDRFAIKVVAGAGLCAAAVVLSPHAAAAPLKTGGVHCLDDKAGGAPLATAGGAPVAPCSAVIDAAAAGVPVAAPVAAPLPIGAPLPIAPPLPIGAPIPIGAPLPIAAGAPALGGAPIAQMEGAATGKGVPTAPPPPGDGPANGVAILPGPDSAAATG